MFPSLSEISRLSFFCFSWEKTNNENNYYKQYLKTKTSVIVGFFLFLIIPHKVVLCNFFVMTYTLFSRIKVQDLFTFLVSGVYPQNVKELHPVLENGNWYRSFTLSWNVYFIVSAREGTQVSIKSVLVFDKSNPSVRKQQAPSIVFMWYLRLGVKSQLPNKTPAPLPHCPSNTFYMPPSLHSSGFYGISSCPVLYEGPH